MGVTTSKADQSLEFRVEASRLAEACQQVIARVGLKVKSISKETGLISAASGMFSLEGGRTLTLKISKTENGSKVDISASASEGLATWGRAQKLLTDFVNGLAGHPHIKGMSVGGW